MEQATADLEETWQDLRECARKVRNRKNNWIRQERVLHACEQIEALLTPWHFQKSFFGEYWRTLETSFLTDPVEPDNLDDLDRQIENNTQDYVNICKNWSRMVKVEKCCCRGKSFASFKENVDDKYLDEFFEWTNKWGNRGYGKYLSF